MAVINLIAQEQMLRRQAERKMRLLGLGWLVAAAFVGVGWGGLLLYMGMLALQRAQIEEKMTQLKPSLQQVQQVQAELNALQPLVNTLQNARKDTGRWQQLFHHFTRHTPEGCFLIGAELGKRNDPKKPLEITLRGVAENQQRVGEFMLRLNQHPDLEKVRLDYSQARTQNDLSSVVEFQIVASIKGTGTPEPEKKEAQSGSQ